MTNNKKVYADKEFLESFSYLVSLATDPINMVKAAARSVILTDEFINEFNQYIDKKTFTLSYRLSTVMADKYPEKFDKEIFIKGVKNFFNNKKEDDEEISEPLETDVMLNPADISISMYSRYANEINTFMDDNNDRSSIVMSIIRNATPAELSDESILIEFIGKYNTDIDELVLKRCKDQELRNSVILLLNSRDGENMTEKAYKYLDDNCKEDLIRDNSEVFLKVLASSKDLGWINTMIKKVQIKEIELIPTATQLDTVLLQVMNKLSEDGVAEMFKLYEYFPNAFSYKLMAWLLNNKSFDEIHLIAGVDIFKKVGLLINLKRIAKENNYTELLKVL